MAPKFLTRRLPDGTGYLIDRGMRIRLAFVVAGSIVVALLEIGALASIMPLVNLMSSGDTQTVSYTHLTLPTIYSV